MATPVTYSVQNDTLNGAVSTSKLDQEIRADVSIPVELVGVTVTGDVLSIEFQADLDSGQTTALDAVVAVHDGVPPTKIVPPTTVEGAPIVKLDAPSERDKKPVVVISPATEGWLTWITGRGDNLSPGPGETGRGAGDAIHLEFSDTDDPDTTKSVLIQFHEPVEVHDGQLSWSPPSVYSFNDYFSLGAIMDATPAVSNGSGTGNANKVEIAPSSGMHVFVPAAGDGAWDIDLDAAVPVPDTTESAYWDLEMESGVITPSATLGSAEWNLFDFPVGIMLINRVGMGNPLGVFDVDVYKTEYIHQNWKLQFEVTKATPANCTAGGWLFMFRRYTT